MIRNTKYSFVILLTLPFAACQSDGKTVENGGSAKEELSAEERGGKTEVTVIGLIHGSAMAFLK